MRISGSGSRFRGRATDIYRLLLRHVETRGTVTPVTALHAKGGQAVCTAHVDALLYSALHLVGVKGLQEVCPFPSHSHRNMPKTKTNPAVTNPAQFLGCPATSASAERIFSLAGALFNGDSTNMNAATLEERMWAKINTGKRRKLK